jgi:hypothetical protein
MDDTQDCDYCMLKSHLHHHPACDVRLYLLCATIEHLPQHFYSLNGRKSLRARLEVVTTSEFDRLNSSDSLPSIEVRRVDRDWDFTIDGADSESRRASGDNLDEKAQIGAHARVFSKKEKPHRAVRIVEPTGSHHEREAEIREPVTDAGGRKARHGLATLPRMQAVDSGYRIRVEMYNVTELLDSSLVTVC